MFRVNFIKKSLQHRYFPVNLHILISLGSKFYPEQNNLNVWIKYAQKRYLGSKPKK